MKRLLIIALAMILVTAFPVTALAGKDDRVSVLLPTYKCIINESNINYRDSQYPLLSYKDITYFPMTWNYCRAMDLISAWEESNGLYIAAFPNCDRPDFEIYPLKGNVNTKTMTATVANYPVYINGEPAPKDDKYPLLNFRGITYFPMTWKYSHDCLGWNLSFVNDVFTVNTLPEYINVETATTDKGVYVKKTMPDNWDKLLESYYLEYETGKVTKYELTEENNKVFEEKKEYKDVSYAFTIKNNMICYNGLPLHEMKALSEGKIGKNDTLIYANECTNENGVTYLVVDAKYNLETPAPYTPKEIYIYLKNADGSYTFVTEDAVVTEAVKCGNDVYFEVRRLVGFRGMTYSNSIAYKVFSDGKTINLNDSFADYNSVSVLGVANNKAYLKCLWAPEIRIDGDEKNLQVSAVNDGIFIYEGSNLKKVHSYIYFTDGFVTPDGDVYGVNNYGGTVKKIPLQ